MALTSTKQRQEIGNRLKEERERLGYSEIQIAQLLGIPIDAYIRFEEGLADPGIYRMPRLSSIGFDVLYIITEAYSRIRRRSASSEIPLSFSKRKGFRIQYHRRS